MVGTEVEVQTAEEDQSPQVSELEPEYATLLQECCCRVAVGNQVGDSTGAGLGLKDGASIEEEGACVGSCDGAVGALEEVGSGVG